MGWQEDKIQRYYGILNHMDVTTEDYPYVKEDIYNLRQMLANLSEKKDIVESLGLTADSTDYDGLLAKWLNVNFDKIKEQLQQIAVIRPPKTSFIGQKKLSINDVSRLTYYFFNSESADMRDLLISTNLNYLLKIDSHHSSKCSVKTVYLNCSKEHYTLLNSNNRLESSMILSGQLAQLYIFNSNPELEKRNEVSIYKDAVKKLYELLFIEYYKDSEYNNEAIALENKKIKEYINSVKTLLIEMETTRDVSKIKSLLQSVFSSGLAFYLKNVYYQNKSLIGHYFDLIQTHLGIDDEYYFRFDELIKPVNELESTARVRNIKKPWENKSE